MFHNGTSEANDKTTSSAEMKLNELQFHINVRPWYVYHPVC